MKRKSFLIFLASIIILSMSFNKIALAEPTTEPAQPAAEPAAAMSEAAAHSYDIQLFSGNQTFNLPKSATSYYFSIPKDAILNDDCYLNLHYAVSNTLISDLSHMSISVNGVPVKTEWIKNIKETSPNHWKVNIPVDKFKVGELNEIKIESDHRSIIGDCADMDNPGNWVVIYSDSVLHISDKSVYAPFLSNFYSSYFNDFERKQSLRTNFMLYKMHSNDLITNLLKLSSSIGSLFSDRNLIDYNVIEGDLNQTITNNSIFIAPMVELEENQNLILPTDKLSKNQGFLSISNNSAESPFYKTVISGESQEGISKATDFISNNELLNQVKDQAIILDSQAKDNFKKIIGENGVYKFSDWGYSDIDLSGAFHHSASLSFIQPDGLQAGKGSYINLRFNHSKILLSDRSLITVYIDGVAINNSKLTQSNAEDGTLKVVIPDSSLKQQIIDVEIKVYNYIGKIDCSKDYDDSAWTIISSDSEVCLYSGRTSIQPALDNFPLFNIYRENNQPDVVMSFSENIKQDDLDIAAIMATRLGQNFKQVFNFDVLSGVCELTEEQKGKDMIFIGSNDEIELPDEVKEALPIVPLGNGQFKIIEGVQLVQEVLQNKTVVQVIRSPWSVFKRIYVITYDNSSNLNTLKLVLSDKEQLRKMANQISIIDNTKDITNMVVIDSVDYKVPITVDSVKQMVEERTGFPWWVILIAFVLALICIILILRLRKKTNQFQDAGDKMKKSQGFGVEETIESEEVTGGKGKK